MGYQSKVQEFGDQIMAIANRVKNQFPEDWKNAHNHKPSGEVYIRRVAHAVSVELPKLQCGLNLKRGNQGLSQDVLCFPNASGARDATGQFPGLEIRDIIGSAGTSNASLVFGDVTQSTIDKGDPGGWVKPEPVSGEPVPLPVPPVPPAPAVKPRPQFASEFGQVNAFYAAQEGLQCVGGMVAGVDASVFAVLRGVADGSITDMTAIQNACRDVLKLQCDVPSMIAWGYDLMAGAKVEDVIKQIRQSDEWKAKHPGETP